VMLSVNVLIRRETTKNWSSRRNQIFGPCNFSILATNVLSAFQQVRISWKRRSNPLLLSLFIFESTFGDSRPNRHQSRVKVIINFVVPDNCTKILSILLRMQNN